MKKIREYYEREALLFENHQKGMYFGDPWNKYWHRTRLSHILKMAKTVMFKSFLDVGCAEGYYLKFIATQGSRGSNIVGLDVAKNYLVKAKKEAYKGSWVLGDAHELPFRNDSFDLVLCSEVLEHLSDPKKAFGEVARVSKKSILISIAGENPLHFFAKKLGLIRPEDPYKNIGHGHIREMKISKIVLRWAPETGCKHLKSLITCYFPVSFFRNHRIPNLLIPIAKYVDKLIGKLPVIREMGVVQIALLGKSKGQVGRVDEVRVLS